MALNIGGIANITILPRGGRGSGDCFRHRARQHGDRPAGGAADGTAGRRFDRGGAIAARGKVDKPLLDTLLETGISG